MTNLKTVLRGHFANKLILSYWLIVIIIAVGFSIFSGQLIKRQTMEGLSRELVVQTRILTQSLPLEALATHDRGHIQTLVLRWSQATRSRITVIAPDGTVLGDSDEDWSGLLAMANHQNRPEIQAARERGYGQAIRYSTTLRRDMLYVALPVWHDKQIAGFVRTALPLQSVTTAVTTNQRAIIWVGMIGLVVALLMAIFVGRRLSKPIRVINRGLREMLSGKEDSTITVNSRDEFSLLAAAINRLNTKLALTIGALKSEKVTLSTILEGMAEAVIELDAKNTIEFTNSAAQRILGFGDGAAGRNLLEVSRIYELANLIDETRRKEESIQREIELVGLEPKHFQASSTLLPNQGIIVVLSDISRLKQLEKVRQEFVANVSHELRTPLTLILGTVDTLDGEKNLKEISRQLEIIRKHSLRLNRLVADLLDLSSIEQKEAKFSFRPVNLKPLIAKMVSSFMKRAYGKNQTLQIKIQKKLSPVLADPDRIEQVVSNLLDNAIKFTPQGGKVVVRALAENDRVRVEVIDNGPGIPEEDQPRIFERFYRVDKARSRELGGTGLGLAIVKHIIETHQGTVWVESVLAGGSKFIFTLPKA